MKFEKKGVVIECNVPNNYSIWLREGFKEVKPVVKPTGKKAK